MCGTHQTSLNVHVYVSGPSPPISYSSALISYPLDVPYNYENSHNVQIVPNVSDVNAAKYVPCQTTPALSDSRSVVARPQVVSCVRECTVENVDSIHPVVLKPVDNGTTSDTEDTLNWVIKDAVLCMLRREENNNLVALRR